jgi:type I restriction enzyme S subunit
MDKINKNPEVRFKGFTEDWVEKLLADEVDFFTGLTYSPSNVVKIGGTLVLRSSNVKNSQIVLTDNVFVESEVVNCVNVIVGDIIIVVRNGSRNLIGKHALIKKNMPNTVIGAFMTGIHTKQSNFINSLLDTNQFEKEIEKNLGATINQITTGALKKMTFWFPKEDEQKRIGTFFQNLDNLITLHQRKYEKLVILKKAMLVKMFPKKGALVPEIRFIGFTEDWEEKEMKEVTSNISDGNWIESNHIFEKGEYRIIQTGNLGLGHFIDKSNNAKYFNQKDFDEVRGNEIFPGDILISRLAEPAGRTIILPSTGFRMVTAVDVTIIRPDSNSFDSTFLMTQLNSSDILNIVNQNVSGTSHRRISRRNLEKTILRVPTLIEQQKIGSYFKNVDNQLSMHRKQLEKLNNIKKACFSKMFVGQG